MKNKTDKKDHTLMGFLYTCFILVIFLNIGFYKYSEKINKKLTLLETEVSACKDMKNQLGLNKLYNYYGKGGIKQ